MRKLFVALVATFVSAVAFAGPPVPEAVKPQLAPISHSIVVTCHNQLAFVAVVFEDGTLVIYDSESGVPAETALYTASTAKSVHGYDACSADTGQAGPRPPNTEI